MAYKLLGFATWRVFRGYLHHKFPGARRKLAIAGVAALAVAGAGTAIAAQRKPETG
jgi:hypothetical protein